MASIEEDASGYRTIAVRRVRAYSRNEQKEYRFTLSLLLRPKQPDKGDATRLSSCAVENGFSQTRFEISGLDDLHALGFGIHYIEHTLELLQQSCDLWIDEYPYDVKAQSAFFLNKE